MQRYHRLNCEALQYRYVMSSSAKAPSRSPSMKSTPTMSLSTKGIAMPDLLSERTVGPSVSVNLATTSAFCDWAQRPITPDPKRHRKLVGGVLARVSRVSSEILRSTAPPQPREISVAS